MRESRELTHCSVKSVVDSETASARCAIDPLSLSRMQFGWTPHPSRKLGVPFHPPAVRSQEQLHRLPLRGGRTTTFNPRRTQCFN